MSTPGTPFRILLPPLPLPAPRPPNYSYYYNLPLFSSYFTFCYLRSPYVYRHAETRGRRIQRACGPMRRPWKRGRNPTSPSPQTQNASRAQKFKVKIPILNFNPQKPNSQLKTQTDVWFPLRDENSADEQGYTVTRWTVMKTQQMNRGEESPGEP